MTNIAMLKEIINNQKVIINNQKEIISQAEKDRNANLLAHLQTQHRVQENFITGNNKKGKTGSGNREAKSSRNGGVKKYNNCMHFFNGVGHKEEFKQIWEEIGEEKINKLKEDKKSILESTPEVSKVKRFNNMVYKEFIMDNKNLQAKVREFHNNSEYK